MKSIDKLCLYTVLVAAFLLAGFRVLAGDSFTHGSTSSTMVTEKGVIGELLAGVEVRQQFLSEWDQITEIAVLGSTYGKSVPDTLEVSLENDSGMVMAQTSLSTTGLPDGTRWVIPLPKTAGSVKDQVITVCIVSQNGTAGSAVSLFYGDGFDTGKYELAAPDEYLLEIGGQEAEGILCLSVTGENRYPLAGKYWQFAGAVLCGMVLLSCWIIYCDRKGKRSAVLRLAAAVLRYRFLLQQLVARDFKTKYKRSIFGVLWSFLNPLLTMMVMYMVFSTLFQSSIPNFPVYLLTGILCWNFFGEVTASCLSSITGNTALISKVYVPKYVYPLSRAFSSTINLGLSLIPLLLVLLITKTAITPRILLILFPLMCLFLFSFGIGLFLASCMVFFRDTQFLWSVVNMLWMYLTPIFYDASIIPSRYMALYQLNPLYHIISAMRVLILEGVSPGPGACLTCLVVSGIPLLLGAWVFARSQDRFVLYL